MKILVLLGTQPQPFTRLIDELTDLLVDGTIEAEVVIQAGHTKISDDLKDKATIFTFLDKNEYNNYIENADIIVTHGGAGSIFDALHRNKKVIAFPRLQKYKEHVDDHQVELVEKLSDLQYIVSGESIKEAFLQLKNIQLKQYIEKREIAREVLKENIG